MSHDIAISVRGLSKSYTINHDEEKHITLAETLLSRIKNPLKRKKKETFWALKDVSFDIGKGEIVGIIGRNGAGKSTLLKILSRITEPSHGEIDLFGKIGSLLEVGTGFHPELTGRENIFLNGAILGMTNAEIRHRFDEIVEFAEVAKFLDTPVKRYSSGMYVRLAFAVAAHLSPDILIIDEVLAVGDSQFQKKCLGKMGEIARLGRTVLFVSHNLAAIRELCTRAVLLKRGSLVLDSNPTDATRHYLDVSLNERRQRAAKSEGFTDVRVVDADGNRLDAVSTLEKVFLQISITLRTASGGTTAGFTIFNELDIPLMSSNLIDCDIELSNEDYQFTVELPVELLTQGKYRVEGAVWSATATYDKDDNLCEFDVLPSPGLEAKPNHKYLGQFALRRMWVREQNFVNSG